MRALLTEKLYPLNEAVKTVCSRVHVSTLHRWRVRGIRGVRLEAVRWGGVWVTSREAVSRFIESTTAQADSKHRIAVSVQPTSTIDPDLEKKLDHARL